MCAGCVAIDILPDDVLLLIFYFDGLEDVDRLHPSWHRLIHVCRKWRTVVFASPNFLDLRLVCGPRTRVELTDIWPPFPIIVRNRILPPMPDNNNFDSAIVLRRSRVREIDLRLSSSWQLQRLASAMREPLPALIHLELASSFRLPAPLPDGFLGGSAPRLRSLSLTTIPFPALPKFLLSANDLVCLTLSKMGHSGYISPQAIHTGLAKLVNLKSLIIKFQSPHSRPDGERRYPPPSIRTVLSSLAYFEFMGVTEYLEDLVARIDAPLLESVCITPFNYQISEFSQLGRFMGLTARFQEVNEAHVVFNYGIRVNCLPPTPILDVWPIQGSVLFRIPCTFAPWDTSSLARVLASLSAAFSPVCTVEYLYISMPGDSLSIWICALTSMQWLAFLRPFSAVKNLYLCKKIAECIASALQELVGESVADVLPALERIFLEDVQPSGPDEDAIGQFVAARQLSGHSVAVSRWNRT